MFKNKRKKINSIRKILWIFISRPQNILKIELINACIHECIVTAVFPRNRLYNRGPSGRVSMSRDLTPPKIHCSGGHGLVKSVEAKGPPILVRRESFEKGRRFRSRPRHLAMTRNYQVCPKIVIVLLQAAMQTQSINSNDPLFYPEFILGKYGQHTYQTGF
ncbi:hypothetical protein AVEN_168751-1 [Araneus ventricosus]|uniref:Uncharacterized protein n=1 Tax=Araneus ventricosus TaxID=182803 RepID=A0A4Y2Q5P4_ARAVE|nr:hypothetical protein AVEN_168751-1 [Araneus ventricosus]